jgi:hypothetical protein
MANDPQPNDLDHGPTVTAPWRVEIWVRFDHDPALETGSQVLLFDVTPHPQEVPIGEALAMARHLGDQLAASVVKSQADRVDSLRRGFGPERKR